VGPLAQALRDYTSVESDHAARQLDAYLRPLISFLIAVRPMSIVMGNVVRFVKAQVTTLPVTATVPEVRGA
jgi:translation initiation factor 2B subunit (eIF-2B alpha/beta/delta family)